MPPGFVWPASKAMKSAGADCLSRLTVAGVKWKRAKARRKIATPITVPDMDFAGLKLTPIWRKGPFVMDCHLAEALTSMASPFRSLGVVEIRFSTIFQYRNIRRRKRPRNFLSKHALGLAIDCYDFVLTDGTKLVVKKDYRRGNKILRALEKITWETAPFRTLLSPGNDRRTHYDHYHFEASIVTTPKISQRVVPPRLQTRTRVAAR